MSDQRRDPDGRPSPDALLQAVQRAESGRGRLKIFLGAAPGVGKTFAMLESAQRAKAEGIDLVVGLVETHGRADTEARVRGLELVPRRQILYRGRRFGEMDVDGVLARKPRLVLVDEYAHSNLGDPRHPKRWQDIEELRDAGIDVWTTLNIQHLESLNDVVARISGVRVRETVPDQALSLADELELIDLTPDELIARLAQGKVYVPEQAQRAIHSFFSKGTLTALRELALRAAADRIDADMVGYMRQHAIPGPWPTQERLLVCIGSSPSGAKLARTAKRMADRARAPWLALHVTPERTLSAADEARLRETLSLARALGGEVVAVPAGRDLAAAILAAAGEHNVSRIVVGRPRRRPLGWPLRRPVSSRLIEADHGFEITVVTPDGEAPRPAEAAPEPPVRPPFAWRPYGVAMLGVALATLVAYGLGQVLPLPNLSLVYLMAVLLIAVRQGLWPAIFASLVSFLTLNFLFTEPRLTFAVSNRSELLSILFFLGVATIAGNMAARMKRQVERTRAAAKRANQLGDFARRVAGAASLDDVLWGVVHHAATLLAGRSLVLMPDRSGTLAIVAGYPPEDELDPVSRGAAEWSFSHGRAAGRGTDTLNAAPWLFLPMGSGDARVAVLGVAVDDGLSTGLSLDQRGLAEAVADQAAVAIERARLAQDIENTRLLSETEKLRAALLSSVSHDLRTPLVSIIGAASSLKLFGETIGAGQRAELVQTIADEAERLNRFVQNLLDMTRLGYGALKPRLDWVDLQDVVARALERIASHLPAERVDCRVAPDLPLVRLDPVLIEQVLVNLLDNAAKYAPAGAAVSVRAAVEGGELRLDVVDQGPGIAPADRERVFDLFTRVEAGDSRPPGTGLGLAICRGIVEAHGGRIAVRDGDDGVGTCIRIALPLAPPPRLPHEDEG